MMLIVIGIVVADNRVWRVLRRVNLSVVLQGQAGLLLFGSGGYDGRKLMWEHLDGLSLDTDKERHSVNGTNNTLQ